MTDLTEQWKKGELESGWYYVKGEKMYEGISIHWIGYPIPAIEKRCIQEVLAPVRSYNEYLESEAHCVVYSEENKRLKELERKYNGNYPDKISQLKSRIKHLLDLQANRDKEVDKLRQLLKECLVYIPYSYPQFQTEKRIDLDSAKLDLLTRINAVIGESEE